jgi:hypothetical protein
VQTPARDNAGLSRWRARRRGLNERTRAGSPRVHGDVIRLPVALCGRVDGGIGEGRVVAPGSRPGRLGDQAKRTGRRSTIASRPTNWPPHDPAASASSKPRRMRGSTHCLRQGQRRRPAQSLASSMTPTAAWRRTKWELGSRCWWDRRQCRERPRNRARKSAAVGPTLLLSDELKGLAELESEADDAE